MMLVTVSIRVSLGGVTYGPGEEAGVDVALPDALADKLIGRGEAVLLEDEPPQDQSPPPPPSPPATPPPSAGLTVEASKTGGASKRKGKTDGAQG